MQDNPIKNRSIIQYLNSKDWIILKYTGQSFKTFINTIFLGLSLKKEVKDSWKVGIYCSEEYKSSIPEGLHYYEPNKTELEFMPIYNILNTSPYHDNHLEIAKSLQIPIPLDISDTFQSNEQKNSILLCLNGPLHLAIPQNIEKEIFFYFKYKGYNINVFTSLDFNHINFWTEERIKPNSLNDMIKVISEHEIIISIDNSLLALANSFSNKKVIGIFGPTIPESSLKVNSMKIIQLYDDKDFRDKYLKKACPCNNPKICHRGYSGKNTPFCLDISAQTLINKIENLISRS